MSSNLLYKSYCYNGQPFQLAYQDTIAFLSGRFLELWDLNTNKRDYIESQKAGFQSFVCHHAKGLLFVADFGMKPNVYIYSIPSKKLLATTNVISELEIIQMDISLDATRLLVVTGVPTYEINIFDISDLENIFKLDGAESAAPLGSKFLQAKFSSQKNNQYAVLYEQSFSLYKIYPTYELEEQEEEQQSPRKMKTSNTDLNNEEQQETNLLKKIRIKAQTIKASPDSQFASFIWDEQNNIYLADKFNARYLKGDDLELIQQHESFQRISFFVLTQKHIILIHDNDFEWLIKYEPSNLEDEELKPFKFDKRFNYQGEKIIQIMYNHTYKKLFAGTKDGSILVMPEEAENFEEDYEEGDQKDAQSDADQSNEIDIDTQQFGPYSVGPIIFIREFEKYNITLTVSENGRIFLWNLYDKSIPDQDNKQLLYTTQLGSKLISAEMCSKDRLLLLGSEEGVLRIMDFSNLNEIKIVKHIKIMESKPIEFLEINKEKTLLCVGSRQSKKIFFINFSDNELSKPKPFKIIGYTKMPFRYNSLCWNTSSKQEHGQGASNLFILMDYFLISVPSPQLDHDYKELNLELEMFGRKIDPDLQHIQVNPKDGNIITTGGDKLLKIYTQPYETYDSLDKKLKAGGTAPDEKDGHPLPANIMKIIRGKLISGGQDGTIYIRDLDDIDNFEDIKAHNLKYNGVRTIEYSKKYPIIYSGGYDGSFFAWQLGTVEIEDLQNPERSIFEQNPEIQDKADKEVTHYKKVLEEEYVRSQKEIQEKKKKEIQDGMIDIQSQLQTLLNQNEQADELEQLDRDEFVIDISTRNEILEQGKEACKKLREEAQKQNDKQEILRERLMEKTWDTMTDHLRAINGLDTNLIVYNYHVRKRSGQERKKLNWVLHYRKMEIKEKQARIAQQQREVVEIKDFIKNPNEYIVNGVPQKPSLVLIDYEALEEQKQNEQQAQHQHHHQHKAAGGGGPQKGAMGGRQGAYQSKAKKEQEAKKLQEEKEEAERKKKKMEEEKKQTEQKDTGEPAEMTEWDFLYGALELFTNNQKRNQIVMLHNIIFMIKSEFNKEFEQYQKLRTQMIDNIQDKNKKIEEILLELHREVDDFQAKPNILENPEKNVLQVDAKVEISFEKYLTREERKKIEEKKRAEEERLRALMADDAGRRAVQQMMNGTLEEKKENPLDEMLEKEDWMDLPQEEMTDEQRIRFKEYEVKLQKQEEEKEKIRKNLESQLKKLRQEIVEICQKFDQKLLILFRRKLEYDYRIAEQELYIVKLSLSIIVEKDVSARELEFKSMDFQIQSKRKQVEDMCEHLKKKYQSQEEEKKQKAQQFEQATKLKQQSHHIPNLDDNKYRNIWKQVFVDEKDNAEKKQLEEKLMSEEQYQDQLVSLDPYIEIRKKHIKQQLEADFNTHKNSIVNKVAQQQIFEMREEQMQHMPVIYDTLRKKFLLKQELEEQEKEIRDITLSKDYMEEEKQNYENQYDQYTRDKKKVELTLQSIKSNIEIILRFKQGFVEINPTDLQDAVLIPREHIVLKNQEVQKQGNEKISLMEAIKNIEDAVATNNFDLRKLKKTIERVECQTREVQLLKVKKEMQLALTKKDMKLNEFELQSLSDQIAILIEATNKRVTAFSKKEEKIMEQIEFIRKENEQLKVQGQSLGDTVKQRQKISDMMSNKNSNQGGDDKGSEELNNKFKQIALNRKYYDHAKRQTESIEILREELNKLKARTFANFSSVQK